ncbi:MAG: hypothetical protein RLZZ74_3506 [Cyanobacteriota bacterium]|jgi:hypothetical protein
MLKQNLSAEIELFGHRPLAIKITNGVLELFYGQLQIWRESIEGSDSFFGIESCDAIARIIVCIDNRDDTWHKYKYIE